MVGMAAGNSIFQKRCMGVSLRLRPTSISTGLTRASPSMVLRITGASPATKPIMMMVSALRPKITRKSG